VTGFVLGAARFILELVDRASGGRFENAAVRALIDINFLHYSIFMFLICCLVLVGVSFATAPPDRAQLAGLTFATVDDVMDVSVVSRGAPRPGAESRGEHRSNVLFSLVLIATVVGLWIYFR
jgi:hypothetical protein